MRLTVLGGCGAWPAADQACSGYLVEHDGFRLLIDPGYAILPRLLQGIDVDEVDAVLVSHGHPDHCADLNPLLRARTFRDDRPPAPALPAYAPPGALRPVLALDRPGALDDAISVREFAPGDGFSAAALQAGRGGPVPQALQLDRGHIAAAFRSEAWLRLADYGRQRRGSGHRGDAARPAGRGGTGLAVPAHPVRRRSAHVALPGAQLTGHDRP